jgi:hypothetical protein
MAKDLGEIRRNADRWTAGRRAFELEHGKLYQFLETTAQLAELAGDDDIAADLRILRRKVARHLQDGVCS